MPDLQSLLARAAELAPEWCEDHGSGVFYLSSLDEEVCGWMPISKSECAHILYAVLKECERQGLHIGIERERHGNQGDMHYFVRLTDQHNQRSMLDDMDVTTAVLTAFVFHLESQKLADAFTAPDGGE